MCIARASCRRLCRYVPQKASHLPTVWEWEAGEKTSGLFHRLTSAEPSEILVFCLTPSRGTAISRGKVHFSWNLNIPWRCAIHSQWRKGEPCEVHPNKRGLLRGQTPHLMCYCMQRVLLYELLQRTANSYSPAKHKILGGTPTLRHTEMCCASHPRLPSSALPGSSRT